MPSPQMKAALERATEDFVNRLVEIFRGAVVGDIYDEAPPARRAKRTSAATATDKTKIATAIMRALKDEGELSSEALQKATGRSKRELFPVLTKLLESKAIRKKGERRGTRYRLP